MNTWHMYLFILACFFAWSRFERTLQEFDQEKIQWPSFLTNCLILGCSICLVLAIALTMQIESNTPVPAPVNTVGHILS